MKIKILILFTLVAILSSLLRFGHRENNLDIASDSDYYLDMAKVLVGEQSEFYYENISSVHHYNRPLLAFCAGFLGHYILGDNYPAAFSIINIIAAIFIAYLLFIVVNVFYPGIVNSWYPSILFLTSFSQMNFGYHILTETIGLAFAFGACYLVYQILVRLDNNIQENSNYKFYNDWKVYCSLFIILIIQMLSFLTRETAWFIFIFIIYIVINRQLYQPRYLFFLILLFLVLLVAKVPHTIYSNTFETYSTPLDSDLKALIDPNYILDSVLKLGIIFNICWIIIFLEFLFWKKKFFSHFHEFIKGWSLAALGYIAAGYLANSISAIGYPTRMFYSLFPFFFISVTEYFDRNLISKKRMYLMSLFFILHASIGIIGVILDSGTDTFHTIYDFFNWS